VSAPRFKAATLTVGQAAQLAAHAGGWNELRENPEPYGAAGRVAALAFGLALDIVKPPAERLNFSGPSIIASHLALKYGMSGQEVMGALYLDTRNRLAAERELYRGTVNRMAVEPRKILQDGLILGACGVVVFHTHPSGDPSPSPEDIAFTRRLAEGGELVGVKLVDHIIVGAVGRWVSLRERGVW